MSAAMAALVADRKDDLLVVPGLGSTTWDLFAAGDDDRNFYLWGAMGGAGMIGLGLALAQPEKRVAVITGDGEMLMGMGSLGTIGIQKPKNLAVIVFDNGVYGVTGMQPSHTQSGADLTAVAAGCGFADCIDVNDSDASDMCGDSAPTPPPPSPPSIPAPSPSPLWPRMGEAMSDGSSAAASEKRGDGGARDTAAPDDVGDGGMLGLAMASAVSVWACARARVCVCVCVCV